MKLEAQKQIYVVKCMFSKSILSFNMIQFV